MTDNIDPRPEFSLIISTVGPAEGLVDCLASFMAQTYGSFEVIIVDQNRTDHVRAMAETFLGSGKVHYTTSAIGLSKGRNTGLALARGRIVAFPDDDCDYPDTLLADIRAQLRSRADTSGICVRCADHQGNDSAGRSDRRSGMITKSNVWQRAVSVGMFLQADAVREAGGFDETIGLGCSTPYLSGEETDLLLSIIGNGHKVYYDPALNVFHPPSPTEITPKLIARSYAYGMGKGLVLRKHDYKLHQIAIHLLKPVLGAVLAALRGDVPLAKLRLTRAKGRLDGWISSRSYLANKLAA